MKVPIDACAAIDLDAPTVAAYRHRTKSGALRYVFSPHCDKLHSHGAGAGHREAHCLDPASAYLRTGYNLAHAERWHELRGRPRRTGVATRLTFAGCLSIDQRKNLRRKF